MYKKLIYIIFFIIILLAGCSEEQGATESNPINVSKSKSELLTDIQIPVAPDVFELRALLKENKFQKLDQLLNNYQQNYIDGSGSEITLDHAVRALGNPDPDYLPHLNEWVKTMPYSAMAYLARASYYHKLAWAKRGTGFARNTTEEQFRGMREAQAKALGDLEKVLELNPKLTIAYSLRIAISSTGGTREEKFQNLVEGLDIDPASYVIRRDMLYFLLPRWGGSYEAIEAFLKDTQQYIDQNPDLAPLMGYLEYAKSWDSYQARDHETTIKLLNSAIDKGKKAWYYQKRADSYYSLKDFETALVDYTNAIMLNKYDPDLYIWRAHTYRHLNKPERALEDLFFAAKLNPYNYDVRKYLGYVLSKDKRYEEAIESYYAALRYRPNDHKIRYKIGWYLNNSMKQPKKAIEEFEKAVSIKPDIPKYWYEYSVALFNALDCKVMDTLNTYLQLCSSNECSAERTNWARQTIINLEKNSCNS